jgi:hypothetical protein
MADKLDSMRRLSACVRSRQAEICDAWRKRVTDDPDVPTEGLGSLELEDHVPELLERIAAALDEFTTWRDDAEARGELAGRGAPALKHVRVRLREGYELSQVLRELHQLRAAIVGVCEAALVHVGGQGAQIIHGAIDASVFIAAVEAERRAPSPKRPAAGSR